MDIPTSCSVKLVILYTLLFIVLSNHHFFSGWGPFFPKKVKYSLEEDLTTTKFYEIMDKFLPQKQYESKYSQHLFMRWATLEVREGPMSPIMWNLQIASHSVPDLLGCTYYTLLYLGVPTRYNFPVPSVFYTNSLHHAVMTIAVSLNSLHSFTVQLPLEK